MSDKDSGQALAPGEQATASPNAEPAAPQDSILQLSIPINAGKVARVLIIIAICLAALGFGAEYVLDHAGDDADLLVMNIMWVFGVNHEMSIPTWFSACLLLGCAVLLTLIALSKRARRDRFARHWTGLALIFFYLSADEGAALHETLTEPLRAALETTGVLYFAWVIAFLPVVAVVALAYLPFLRHLPVRVRNLFVLAGLLYVGGAIFIESLSANLWYLDAGSSTRYGAVGTLEELAEMLGAVVMLYTLLSYIAHVHVGVRAQSDAATLSPPAVPGALLPSRSILRTAQRPALIMFAGGMNLILIQWVLARELTALLLGTELVVLLVSVAYFAGLSVGYLLAGRIRRAWLAPLGAVTLILHLTLPIWFRLLVAGLDAAGAYGLAYLVLPVLTPFVVSAFYSVFLPLFADSGDGGLPQLYALELAGAAAGVLALVLLGGIGLQAVAVIYALGLLLILWALRLRPLLLAGLAGIAAAWLILLPGANLWSSALWYVQVRGLPEGTRALFSGYSPYQKVDVLETPWGLRFLYLDSLEHFGSTATHRLDVIGGEIPASITRPSRALVVGAGSMEMAAMIAAYSGHVTTVEIDPLVVSASLEYFGAVNRMDTLENRTVVIDDAKHFIANDPQEYNLIAAAPPAAYSLQAATLYSLPFYRMVQQHLAFDGVFVANLTSTFGPDDLVSRRIAAGLLLMFDDVLVVTADSVGWSFAYASDNLPFNAPVLEAALRKSGEVDFVIHDTAAVRAIVGDAQPITLDSMDIVLHMSAERILERLR